MSDRPVSNLLGLAVLGVLAQRPMHRYEIATTIREQGKDADMAVKWGSLYTVVGSLERHGFVEAVETTREGARPERTVYRITGAGRVEMADWTRELLADLSTEQTRLTAGLSMLGSLPPDEALTLLRDRLARLDALLADRRDRLAAWRQQVSRLFLVETEYGVAMQQAEADWLRALLADLDSGDFPDLARWRAYHEAADEEGADQDH
jgi:DNA-binding PadR family transcriptional regulator